MSGVTDEPAVLREAVLAGPTDAGVDFVVGCCRDTLTDPAELLTVSFAPLEDGAFETGTCGGSEGVCVLPGCSLASCTSVFIEPCIGRSLIAITCK